MQFQLGATLCCPLDGQIKKARDGRAVCRVLKKNINIEGKGPEQKQTHTHMLSEIFREIAHCQVWDSVLGTITEANRIMGDVGSHQGEIG